MEPTYEKDEQGTWLVSGKGRQLVEPSEEFERTRVGSPGIVTAQPSFEDRVRAIVAEELAKKA